MPSGKTYLQHSFGVWIVKGKAEQITYFYHPFPDVAANNEIKKSQFEQPLYVKQNERNDKL